MQTRNRVQVTLALALCLAGAVGCESMEKMGEKLGPKPFQREIEMDGQVFTIKSSGTQHSNDGVARLGAQQWKEAATDLEAAVAEKKTDGLSWKALGVAYEMAGDKAKAYNAYSQANLLMKEPDALVTRKLGDLKPPQ